MTVSDEAIEAAAASLCGVTPEAWKSQATHTKDTYRWKAIAALRAAAPHMAAECDGGSSCASISHIEGCFSTNPDYAAPHMTLPQADLRPHIKQIQGAASQAYIVECEDMEPGDQIWFPNLFEAEQTCGPFPSCCVPKPVGDDYDGPKWAPE